MFLGKKVFVTGATGFIGINLINRLAHLGANIGTFVLDEEHTLPKSVKIYRGNIESSKDVERAVKRFNPEYVFHLAAQPLVGVAMSHPLDTLSTNIMGTANVMQALVGTNVKAVVMVSTDKVYGSYDRDILESDTLLGTGHPYDTSKMCGDFITQMYARCYNVPVVIVRSGNIYGEGDTNYDRLIPGIIFAALNGEKFVIRSDGNMVRDYIYVEDVLDAYITLLRGVEKKKIPYGAAVNIGAQTPMSVFEIVGIVSSFMGDIDFVVADNAVNEIPYQHLDWSYAKELGWTPQTSIYGGIQKTIRWHTLVQRG